MAAAAQMSDLKPLPGSQRAGGEHTGQHRDMVQKVRAVCVRAAICFLYQKHRQNQRAVFRVRTPPGVFEHVAW